MKRILALVPVVALSLVTSGVLLAQENPFVGTWQLNVAKSKFTGQQPLKSETRTIEAQGGGQRVRIEGIRADGSWFEYSYTSNLDGKDSPFSGTGPYGGAETIAITRVDANTHTVITKKAGKRLPQRRA
jgi:hypothetical protein